MLANLEESEKEMVATPRRFSHFDGEIFDIVANSDLESLKLMVKHGTILADVLDYDGRNLLHVACCGGNLPMVKYLIAEKVDVNQRDSKDYTPLYEAMSNWNREIVTILEENGAILISGNLGSKLCKAASDGNILRLDSILRMDKYLGKVNIADYDHRSALHLAACNGHLTTVKWLLEHGADPFRKDRFGNQAIDDAMRYEHTEIVKYLDEYCKGNKFKRDGRRKSAIISPTAGAGTTSHKLLDAIMENKTSNEVAHGDYVLMPSSDNVESTQGHSRRRQSAPTVNSPLLQLSKTSINYVE